MVCSWAGEPLFYLLGRVWLTASRRRQARSAQQISKILPDLSQPFVAFHNGPPLDLSDGHQLTHRRVFMQVTLAQSISSLDSQF